MLPWCQKKKGGEKKGKKNKTCALAFSTNWKINKLWPMMNERKCTVACGRRKLQKVQKWNDLFGFFYFLARIKPVVCPIRKRVQRSVIGTAFPQRGHTNSCRIRFLVCSFSRAPPAVLFNARRKLNDHEGEYFCINIFSPYVFVSWASLASKFPSFVKFSTALKKKNQNKNTLNNNKKIQKGWYFVLKTLINEPNRLVHK